MCNEKTARAQNGIYYRLHIPSFFIFYYVWFWWQIHPFQFCNICVSKIGLSVYIILSCFYCMSAEIEFTRCVLNKGYMLNNVETIYFWGYCVLFKSFFLLYCIECIRLLIYHKYFQSVYSSKSQFISKILNHFWH